MSPGRADQEQAMMPARLVPQSDGYADYVDQPQQGPGQHAPARAQQAGRTGHAGRRTTHRKDRASRQRSIRSTIMILLVLPLVSLVALWAYAASSTVGGALAKRNSDTLNKDLGVPLAALIQALSTERADTFVWQSVHDRMPRTTMDKDRTSTSAAIAMARGAIAAVAGLEPAGDKPAATALLNALNNVRTIEAQVDAGTIKPLAAFQSYSTAEAAIWPYVNALNDPQAGILENQQGRSGTLDGRAVDDIGQEAALVGGVLASGGRMPADVYRQFVETVDNQRLLWQLGTVPTDWQLNADPYPAVLHSPAYANLSNLENQIIAKGAGARFPVNPKTWLADVSAVVTAAQKAGLTFQSNATKGQAHDGDVILLRLIIVGGAGLIAVIVSSILLLGFGNRISRELTGLRGAARRMAGERLPSVVSRLRAGDDVDVAVEAPPLELNTRTREVTETADAFSVVQRTAVEAAVDQARLRKGVSLVFRSLARRNQSLLQRQLKMLDEMERGTEDPDALEQLFRLDHLTTRMRRQAEGLIILSGSSPGRAWRQPVPVVEVLRGAVGEIEDYARVDLLTDSPDFMQGTAVADVTHILAELIENAVLYSPPGTRVQVRGGRVANGYVLEVEDRGLGIPADTLLVLNDRLARPPEFDLADSDQLGLFVVSRLAARHGVKVSLRVSGYGGTTAIVLLPHSLVVAEEDVPFLAGQAARTPAAPVAAGIGRAAAAVGAAEALTGREHMRSERALGSAFPVETSAFRTEAPMTHGDSRTAAVEGPAPSGLLSRKATPQDSGQSSAGPGGLPRRQAGTSMAPQLRENRPGTPTGPLAGRSPEQARALMSAIQQGLRSGRASTPTDTDDSPGTTRGWTER